MMRSAAFLSLLLIPSSVVFSADPLEPSKVREAIDRGDLKGAIQEVIKLPLQERVKWVETLSESRARLPLTTSSSQPLPTETSGNPSSSVEKQNPVAAGGGGAFADFSQLNGLITTLIDTDKWGDTQFMFNAGEGGGLGGGVWIDPKGIVQPRKNPKLAKSIDTKDVADPIVLAGIGPWQISSKLRWISLTKLEQQISARMAEGKSISASMELLGGLARIDFVSWKADTQEWLIGGPAGDFSINADGELVHSELRLPPVLLEDLLTVAPHVLGRKGILGCSIDPSEERLANVRAFLADKSSASLLGRAPDKWSKQVVDTLGPQNVTIYGLPKDSPTGLALLVADQHMKRLGLGLEKAPPGFADYIRIAEQVNSVPGQGLVRWWFAVKSQPIDIDDSGSIYALPAHSVQVMSEKEWMDANGKREATGNRDRAADLFAKAFTDRFDDLQKQYPMYGRLRHVFDLTIAMEIIRRAQTDSKGELVVLRDSRVQPHMPTHPEFVPSITTHRKLANKQIVAMVSGGVVIQPNGIAVEFNKVSDGMPNASRAVAEHPSNSKLDWILTPGK